MTYNPKNAKRCFFNKMSSKGRKSHTKKKKNDGYTSDERAKILTEWRDSWFGVRRDSNE